LLSGKISKAAATDAIAIVETASATAAVLGADAAAKAADVRLLDLKLGQGLGGKGFFTMTGELDSIEAAVSSSRAVIDPSLIVGLEIVARPHEDLHARLIW